MCHRVNKEMLWETQFINTCGVKMSPPWFRVSIPESINVPYNERNSVDGTFIGSGAEFSIED